MSKTYHLETTTYTGVARITRLAYIEIGKKHITQKTCLGDAIRSWNDAPKEMAVKKSKRAIKLQLKKFVMIYLGRCFSTTHNSQLIAEI